MDKARRVREQKQQQKLYNLEHFQFSQASAAENDLQSYSMAQQLISLPLSTASLSRLLVHRAYGLDEK